MAYPDDLLLFLNSGGPVPGLPPEPDEGMPVEPATGLPDEPVTVPTAFPPDPTNPDSGGESGIPGGSGTSTGSGSLLTRGMGGPLATLLLRGRGLLVPPPILPWTLIGAIVYRFRRTPELVAALPGGVGVGIAPPRTPLPYLRLHQIAAVPGASTAGVHLETTLLQADIFATTEAELAAIRRLWGSYFHPKMTPLLLRDGYVTGLYCGNDRPSPDDGLYPGATRAHRWTFEIRALVGRNGPLN